MTDSHGASFFNIDSGTSDVSDRFFGGKLKHLRRFVAITLCQFAKKH